jgi:hypothetical protein
VISGISIMWGELYNHDLRTENVATRHPSALKWGKKVLGETWKFVLTAWKIRNETEHDNTGDPIRRTKLKLSNQILWSRDQIDSRRVYPLKRLQRKSYLCYQQRI